MKIIIRRKKIIAIIKTPTELFSSFDTRRKAYFLGFCDFMSTMNNVIKIIRILIIIKK